MSTHGASGLLGVRRAEYWLKAVSCTADTSAPSHTLVVACSHALAMFDGKLFAVGGQYGHSFPSVETLSLATGTWVTEANALNVARRRCADARHP